MAGTAERERSAPRVVLLTKQDPADRKAYSGTLHWMARALEAAIPGLETVILNERPQVRAVFTLRKVLRRLGFQPGQGTYARLEGMAERAAVRAIFRRDRPDVVVAPVSARYLPAIPEDLPVVYCSDATFGIMDGYYPHLAQVSAADRARRNAEEAAVAARADVMVYASDWAARSAVEDYGADPARIRIAPFGANIATVPDAPSVLRQPDPKAPRFLFVGREDWARKGGDVALEAVETLRARGRDAVLTVIGLDPPVDPDHPGVRRLGYLDKTKPEKRALFEDAFFNSDFFLMPTRAEALGIVFCEAAAYGLPVLSTDTGGVSTVVSHGETGILLPPKASGTDFADAAEGLLDDPDRLLAMRRAARARFETALNWTAWGESMAREVRALAAGQRP